MVSSEWRVARCGNTSPTIHYSLLTAHQQRHNEPEPDVVLTTALDGAPRPEDVLLLIEVADSSLSYDRTVKLPLYAQAVCPRYGS